jgi:SRSO17 transposase
LAARRPESVDSEGSLAEHAGHDSPDGLQHLLRKAKWDIDGVRDDLRAYVVERLGEVDAVLVVDETGDLEKGAHTVGVQRQYTGTAGRIENAQVAVYLTYAGAAGHALIDRELYRPRVWADDTARRDQAGVPAEVTFATKPALATEMITRALDAGIGARWVTGDEVYGGDPKLRETLEDRGIGYVLAVACSHQVRTGAGKIRADELAASLPRRAWQRLSAVTDPKGHGSTTGPGSASNPTAAPYRAGRVARCAHRPRASSHPSAARAS